MLSAIKVEQVTKQYHDLRALDASDGSPLLDWKSLQLRGLQLVLAPAQPLQLSVAETTLSDYFARIDIDPSGRVNLQDLLRPPATEPAMAAAAAAGPIGTSASPTTEPPAQLSLGPIALLNGNIASMQAKCCWTTSPPLAKKF